MHREMEKRFKKAGELVASQTKRNLSISSKAQGPSKPGEFPHVVHGRLRNSIFWKLNASKLIVIIGTPLWYGLWLEKGTTGGTLIRPVEKEALSWEAFRAVKESKPRKAGGKVRKTLGRGLIVFAKKVIQGPILPRPFLSRKLKETRERWKKILLAPMKPPRNP